MRDRAMEDMLQNEISLLMKQRQAEMEMKIAQLGSQMQQMMMAQQQGAPQGMGQGAPPSMEQGPPPGMEPPPSGGLNEPMFDALKGDGVNPAQGGMSTAQAVPAGTKEMLTRMDRAGEQTAV